MTTASKTQKKDRSKIWIGILKVCLFITAGAVIFLNIQPYQKASEYLFFGAGGNPLIRFFRLIPGIGWLINSFEWLVSSIIGVAVWAVFQILEVLPLLLFGTQDSLQALIKSIENSKQLQLKDSDSPAIRQLKIKHNQKPFKWLSTAKVVATFAYLADLIFVSVAYPPIKGGIDNLGLFLAAPSFQDIDLKNLALTIITLFAVEGIVLLWIWLGEYAEMRKKGGKASESR